MSSWQITGGFFSSFDVSDANTVSLATLKTSVDAKPTAAQNADAVWDEATSGHVSAGTFGLFISKLLTLGKFLALK